VQATDKYLNEHHVERRMITLDQTADKQSGEAINRDVLRAMEHGMNKIRKLYESPFSPQIIQARLQRRFYKVHLSMICNHLDLRCQLQSITVALEATLPAPRNLTKAQALLKAAQKNVKELNKKAAILRVTYLEEQAMLLEGNNDKKAADIRQRILKAEQLTQMFKKLRSYLRPNQHNHISHVLVPADGKPPKELNDWVAHVA
jgi:hypothetical protein